MTESRASRIRAGDPASRITTGHPHRGTGIENQYLASSDENRPGGTSDNSPAFQRRVALKRRAIINGPYGTGAETETE